MSVGCNEWYDGIGGKGGGLEVGRMGSDDVGGRLVGGSCEEAPEGSYELRFVREVRG